LLKQLLGAVEARQTKLAGRGLFDGASRNRAVAHLGLSNTLVAHRQTVEVLLDLTSALAGKLFSLPKITHELREVNANAK
jgi:hypothetical protein